MRCQGKIVDWKDERGFGFIEPNEGGKQVFIHITSFIDRPRRPVVGDAVSYTKQTDARGRLQAGSVSLYDKPESVNRRIFENVIFVLLALSFLTFVVFSAYSERLPLFAIIYYFVLSGVTYFAYSFDKSAAEDDGWRIAERVLHFLALIGGWPGALFAQVFIRHKSKKQSFRFVFWITVFLNCLVMFFSLL